MVNAVILAGDVGGTKTYLAACDPESRGFSPLAERRYSTVAYSSLGELLRAFVREIDCSPSRVVLGVPGPVRQLPVRAVNLPWLIDPEELRAALGAKEVHLLNDLEATAYGTRVLAGDDLVELNQGQADSQGNVAVIAAGTGLGEGGLCWTGDRYVALASEGGHSTFAPGSDLEAELWRYLNQRFDHVSWERVVSGPGLASVYEFLRDRDPAAEPEWLRRELEAGDRSSIISRTALEGHCALAAEALDLFVHLYGCEAGNLALKFMATGGLYVGGGIAPKILDWLRQGRFMEGFLDKGRMRAALQAIPVHVILNDRAALLGAAYWGAHFAGA
jgi:glucokinase